MSVDERATVGAIFRLVSALALVWGVSPRFVLFVLSMDAPDEAEFVRMVARSWDRLPASQQATLNALAAEVAA